MGVHEHGAQPFWRSIIHRCTALLILALPWAAGAADIALKLPELPNQRHVFYQQLLEESLRASGHVVRIELVKDVPQRRIWLMIDSGEMDVYWGLQTQERDGKYVGVNNNVTQGLLSKRVLLVPKGDAARYAKVASLADFRELGLTGVFGQGWFDAKVWAFNQLPHTETSGTPSSMFKMVEIKDRGVDYFARGANEIVEEAKTQPGLEIEPRLLLVYDRDAHFYLSKGAARHKPLIEEALARADASGLKKRLIEANYGAAIASLDLHRRTQLLLKTPTE